MVSIITLSLRPCVTLCCQQGYLLPTWKEGCTRTTFWSLKPLSFSQEAPLTWLPSPVPRLNDGLMYRCQHVLIFFLFFVIGFILFLRSKTICAILCLKKKKTAEVAVSCYSVLPVFRFWGCTCVSWFFSVEGYLFIYHHFIPHLTQSFRRECTLPE